MSFFFHYGSEQWIHSCCAHSPLLGATIFSTDVFTIYIIYFCKRSNEYLQNYIFLLIKMLENAVESILTKSVMKATPLPQDVTQAFWPSFPFHVVWFCGIFQKLSCFKTKIKKTQEQRWYLNFLWTNWLITVWWGKQSRTWQRLLTSMMKSLAYFLSKAMKISRFLFIYLFFTFISKQHGWSWTLFWPAMNSGCLVNKSGTPQNQHCLVEGLQQQHMPMDTALMGLAFFLWHDQCLSPTCLLHSYKMCPVQAC